MRSPRTPAPPRPIRILGTGHALPGRRVASESLDRELGLPSGSVQAAGGVRHRHFASRDEHAASLGALAARRALEAAGLVLADIDCLVAANGTMDQAMPGNAALLHREMGLHGVPALDVGASCLSFLVALDTLSWPLAAGRYGNVLVVSADIASCGLDWQHLEASAIFGDGAAAAVMVPASAGQGSRILASSLRTLSEGAGLCEIPGGGSRYHPSRIDQAFDPLARFRMDGKAVFKLASVQLPGFVDRLLTDAGLGLQDIDWVVPHQASQLAITHLTRRLGLAPSRVVDIFAEHGNQVAASLPTALDIAVREGRVRRGDRLMLVGTGAGLSLGGMVLEF